MGTCAMPSGKVYAKSLRYRNPNLTNAYVQP